MIRTVSLFGRNVGYMNLFMIAAAVVGKVLWTQAIRSFVQKVKCRVTELLLLSDTFSIAYKR